MFPNFLFYLFTCILQTGDVTELELKIGCGQVEELILQAENELILACKMLTWKPWELLITKPVPNQWTWPCTK
jgi:NADH dehydrogenase (ubiquinone) 1 alpha subcomplex subunit 5